LLRHRHMHPVQTCRLLAAAAALSAALSGTSAAADMPPVLTPPMNQFVASPQAMPALIQRYQLDYASLDHLYTVQNGSARTAQLQRFYQQWHTALEALPFERFDVEDRIDWVMLRNQIAFELREQA